MRTETESQSRGDELIAAQLSKYAERLRKHSDVRLERELGVLTRLKRDIDVRLNMLAAERRARRRNRND